MPQKRRYESAGCRQRVSSLQIDFHARSTLCEVQQKYEKYEVQVGQNRHRARQKILLES